MDTMFQIFVGHHVNGEAHRTPEQVDRIITDILCRDFKGFTLTRGTGFWEGKSEPCTVVTIVGNSGIGVEFAADNIRTQLDQESVLVTETMVRTTEV